jgi:hypothetical protein
VLMHSACAACTQRLLLLLMGMAAKPTADLCCLQGTSVGGHLRKLYDPWQFPEAHVLGLFNDTYGPARSGSAPWGLNPIPYTPLL